MVFLKKRMLNKRSRKKSSRKKSLKRVNKKSSKKKKIKGGELGASIFTDQKFFKVLPMDNDKNKLQLLELSDIESSAYKNFKKKLSDFKKKLKDKMTKMSSEDLIKYHNYFGESQYAEKKKYQFRIGYNENPGKIFMELENNIFYQVIELSELILPKDGKDFDGLMKN